MEPRVNPFHPDFKMIFLRLIDSDCLKFEVTCFQPLMLESEFCVKFASWSKRRTIRVTFGKF